MSYKVVLVKTWRWCFRYYTPFLKVRTATVDSSLPLCRAFPGRIKGRQKRILWERKTPCDSLLRPADKKNGWRMLMCERMRPYRARPTLLTYSLRPATIFINRLQLRLSNFDRPISVNISLSLAPPPKWREYNIHKSKRILTTFFCFAPNGFQPRILEAEAKWRPLQLKLRKASGN